VAKIHKQFPNGIPAPDPNTTLNTNQVMGASQGSSRSSGAGGTSSKTLGGDVLKAVAQAASTSATPGGRAWAQPRVVVPPEGQSGIPLVINTQGRLECQAKGPAQKKERTQKQLEAEYGPRVALMMANCDPRKDNIQKHSRLQSAVEQERAAKRQRRLAELEAMDDMEERMEAVMHTTVKAWKCQQCHTVTESDWARTECTKKGHIVLRADAKKTHWKCKGCPSTIFVLDRQLPDRCNRCTAMDWKQVPFSSRRAAPMPRDEFLPRGEELPFVNSLPTRATRRNWGLPEATCEGLGIKERRPKEDDYGGLENRFYD
jgi:hypothetical protein